MKICQIFIIFVNTVKYCTIWEILSGQYFRDFTIFHNISHVSKYCTLYCTAPVCRCWTWILSATAHAAGRRRHRDRQWSAAVNGPASSCILKSATVTGPRFRVAGRSRPWDWAVLEAAGLSGMTLISGLFYAVYEDFIKILCRIYAMQFMRILCQIMKKMQYIDLMCKFYEKICKKQYGEKYANNWQNYAKKRPDI